MGFARFFFHPENIVGAHFVGNGKSITPELSRTWIRGFFLRGEICVSVLIKCFGCWAVFHQKQVVLYYLKGFSFFALLKSLGKSLDCSPC